MKNHNENLEVSFAEYSKDEAEIKQEFMSGGIYENAAYSGCSCLISTHLL